MNAELADFKRFHSLNHTAMTKILKKHDKQSGLTYVCVLCLVLSLSLSFSSHKMSLNQPNNYFYTWIFSARTEFPTFAKDNVATVENVLLALYTTVTSKLISIVPQIDNHSCPICFGKQTNKKKKKQNSNHHLMLLTDWSSNITRLLGFYSYRMETNQVRMRTCVLCTMSD